MRNTTILLYIFFYINIYGQNIIPNPSFEVYITCPDETTKLNNLPPWESPNPETPDVFNSCAGSNCTSFPPTLLSCVPSNWHGFQQPHSGDGYVGIFVEGEEDREYLQVKLNSALKVGVDYQLSYYISLADNWDRAIDNFGVYFSSTKISGTNLLNYLPQSVTPNGFFIANKEEWILITDTISAIGGEQYMTIGNFKDELNTNFIKGLGGEPWLGSLAGEGRPFSYYFLDDFSLIEIEPENKCELPEINLGNDTILCEDEKITLDATLPDATYLWNDNSLNSTLNVNETGEYWVKVTTENCNLNDTIYIQIEDCRVQLKIPNFISPNKDGYNDLFVPITSKGIESMTTQIYNRWGNKIFESNNLMIEWDGEGVLDGTYFWVINYVDENGLEDTLNGYLTLIH